MALHNDVFKQQIWEFFQNDIDSCLQVSRDMQKKGNNSIFKGGTNFIAALVSLVVLEMCASYSVGRKASDNDAAKFIKKYLSKYEAIFQFESVCKKFFQIFRHGLAHNWSPKMSGVAMDFNLDKSIAFAKGIPILNVPAFYEVLKKGIAEFENDLDNNQTLRVLFDKRYNEVISGDKAEIERLEEIFKKLDSKS